MTRPSSPDAKLSPPLLDRLPVGIERSAVFAQLLADPPPRIASVMAPAGYGKSILLAQLHHHLQAAGTATAWLTMDQADNDLSRFLNFLHNALDKVGVQVEATQPTHSGERVLQLLDAASATEHAFALFFDECEVVTSPSVLACLRQLIERLPSHGRVVLAGRTLPELGLARWRGRGELVELGMEALRFTPEDTRRFLELSHGDNLGAAEVDLLYRATEGWAVALWLAVLALRDAPDRQALASGFSGSTRLVADYLSEEVFAAQSRDIQEFLLRISVLPYLDCAICDVLCDIEHSDRLLQELADDGLFVSPLDDPARSYRLHHLFADFLRHQLERRDPVLRKTLQAKAARWFLQQGRVIPAIDQAVAAGDLEFALPLLAKHSEQLLGEGRSRLLVRILDAVPAHALQSWPQLQGSYLWAVAFTRSANEALEMLQSHTRCDGSLGDGAALGPMLQVILDRHDVALEQASELLPAVDGPADLGQAILRVSLAYELLVHGDPEQAQNTIDNSRRLGLVDCNRFASMFAQSVEVAIHLFAGRLRTALAQLRTLTGSARGGGSTITGILLAESLYESGEVDNAERLLAVYLPAMIEQGIPDHLISGFRTRSRIHFLRGEVDAALQALTELEHLGYQNNQGRLVASARLERARLALRRGQTDTAGEFLRRALAAFDWDSQQSLWLFGNDTEFPDMLDWRLQVHRGQGAAALPEMRRRLAQYEGAGRMRRALSLRLLMACAESQRGRTAAAVKLFQQVLQQARVEGYRRLLLDEGDLILPLLRAVAPEFNESMDSAALLESLCCGPAVRAATPALPTTSELADPPTEREREVLALLAEGLSNKDIAEQSHISVSTVRAHLRNINGKLGAKSRTEAVAIARRLGLLT